MLLQRSVTNQWCRSPQISATIGFGWVFPMMTNFFLVCCESTVWLSVTAESIERGLHTVHEISWSLCIIWSINRNVKLVKRRWWNLQTSFLPVRAWVPHWVPQHSCMSSQFSIAILNGTCDDVPARKQLNYKHVLQTDWRNLFSDCETRQSHVTSCQIRNIIVRHVSKVKGRYGNIDKYFNSAYFEIIQQLKHILQWSLYFAASV